MDELFFIYNNEFFRAGTPVISTGNRSLMYGDGLFETMRAQQNTIVNKSFHFDRFRSGLDLLKLPLDKGFTDNFFYQKIEQLLLKNKIQATARIRLMAFREGDSMPDKKGIVNYILEAWPIEETLILNEAGLKMDVFTGTKKSCDPFSNLKSNNYLYSVMAQLYAKENGLDECLVLNSHDRICESAIANVFIIKNNIIYTPSLSEGCVAGVIRRWLIENLPFPEFQILQKEIRIQDILEADELFLTNSLKPVRWVKTFRNKKFINQRTREIAQFIHRNMK
ncbi:MAG: aminotransferase class IV [Ginsengibacter sp.]